MRAPSMFIAFCGFLASVASADGEQFWTNTKEGRFQACFREGHDWYFCTGALSGTWSSYKYKLALGDGYQVQFSDNGRANVTSTNGCYKAHCTPRYDSETDFRICDLITDSPNC